MAELLSGTFQPAHPPKGWKEFYGDFIVESEGTIFLPYVLAGCSQTEVFLCASYDGAPVVQQGKISFYRADWLRENFPKMRKAIDRAVEAVNDARQKKLGPFSPTDSGDKWTPLQGSRRQN